jgi:hypothetical protein
MRGLGSSMSENYEDGAGCDGRGTSLPAANLDRLKALWAKLSFAKPGTPDYEALVKQIRAESDMYRALTDQRQTPRRFHAWHPRA